jgi:N-acetylmuramoyl-L-alanine amidase
MHILLLLFLLLFSIFTANAEVSPEFKEHIPDGIIITREASSQMQLDEILGRIAQITAQDELDSLLEKVALSKNSVQKRKTKMVIIDAGHGGKDPGTTGIMGTIEKELTLQYAILLAKNLKELGYSVLLTRQSDSFLSLVQRRKFAQDYKGSLMIALHADSAENLDARGISFYTLSSEASDDIAKMLAESHSNDDITFKTSTKDEMVKSAFINIAQSATISLSEYFAQILVQNAKKNKLFVIPRPHRKAGFAVLKMPDVPSVLVELGFLSSPEEEILLRSQVYRNQIIETIGESVDDFFGVND